LRPTVFHAAEIAAAVSVSRLTVKLWIDRFASLGSLALLRNARTRAARLDRSGKGT
jgi:transposase